MHETSSLYIFLYITMMFQIVHAFEITVLYIFIPISKKILIICAM